MSGFENQPVIYKTWMLDSTRWNHFRPREGDVIIGTYPKSGTTWMQRIVDLLIFQSAEPRPISDLSPWIDERFRTPIEIMIGQVEAQRHRRYFKSHLPFDGLPYFEQVRYIHVARDGRDVCMSWHNHLVSSTTVAERMGGPALNCPSDVRTFWHEWLTKGVQRGVHDGYPGLSLFDLETTYWHARGRPNLLLVHYNDLKADLESEMLRIAAFLSIEVDREQWPRLVEAATFENMKRQGKELLAKIDATFDGGTDRFLFKGTTGRWRERIDPGEIALYEEKVKERLTPGLARWLESGRLVTGDPRTAPD